MSDLRNVRLSDELCAAAEKKFAARFKSVEELLEFVLQDLLREDAAQLDEKELGMIEKRLRELGYL